MQADGQFSVEIRSGDPEVLGRLMANVGCQGVLTIGTSVFEVRAEVVDCDQDLKGFTTITVSGRLWGHA